MKYSEVLEQFSGSLDEIASNARFMSTSDIRKEISLLFKEEYQEIDKNDKVRLLAEKIPIYEECFNKFKGVICWI